jgi:protein-tyrosine-phosphatase
LPDPKGQDSDAVRAIRDEVERRIEELASQLDAHSTSTAQG